MTIIDLPDGVTSIGGAAFYGCSGLRSIEIPNSVTSIGDSAFYDCSGLTMVVIPNSVTSIGGSAFMDCSGLVTVTIGSSVESIGDEAFANCNKLEEIYALSRIAVVCNENVFSSTAYRNVVLYVPEGREFAYERTVPWCNFYILPLPTAINGIAPDNMGENVPIYNMQGVRMKSADDLHKGVYIKGGRKVLVR